MRNRARVTRQLSFLHHNFQNLLAALSWPWSFPWDECQSLSWSWHSPADLGYLPSTSCAHTRIHALRMRHWSKGLLNSLWSLLATEKRKQRETYVRFDFIYGKCTEEKAGGKHSDELQKQNLQSNQTCRSWWSQRHLDCVLLRDPESDPLSKITAFLTIEAEVVNVCCCKTLSFGRLLVAQW